ncbi:MBG domain-containing protein [Sellimonas intestinalis]|uniref:DUF7507 domain-containing protein n=1 Tax=Sellimonas intestinalis TaxID=1653434 RepID=UPI0039A0ED40
MRRAKRITALAVAAAMVLSNVAYAAPDTNTTTTQQGAESLNSQSDASGGVKDQASDTKGNTSTSASQSKEQVKQNESSQSTDPGDQKQTDSKSDAVSQNQDQKKDEDSKETQKPSTEADSQKSETQNVDADKSEDTQEPSKEQEKVLYDITFDTPEKHGRVTDLDGKEVADGKTLKTDENGKAKFKVKPDAGYQVQAVYQMPDEQTPLKLVKDSYYEMQVEKNTTVKVVYQKIPAKNDSEDAGEDDSQKAEDVKGEADTSESKGNEQNVDQQKNETEKATSNAKEDFSQNDVKEEKSPIANWFSAAPSNEVSPYSIEDNTATGEIYYEVRFVDENEGLIWEPQYVLDGTFTTAPILSWENVTESGKHFVGWKSSLDEEIYTSAEICEREVKQDITYKAVFKTNQKYEVRIEYVYVDQSGKTIGQADQPYVAEVDFGESYQNVVNSPKIPGFTPDKTEVNINLSEGQEQDYVETVKYTGAPKEYTVIHQLQNLDDDGYTDQYKETLQGTIGLKTNAVAKDYDGFTAQPIENVTLQNDGETIIYVKYTRNSYVLTYNSHGGTYVGPVTLKYGAKISYPGYDTMKRVGYEFAGWKEQFQYPTMPAQDLTVNALWNDAKTASYTVVYWLENFTGKNGLDGYDYITAKTKTGQVDDMTSYEKLTRSEWEDANIDPDGVELNSQTQNIKIKADGSTVVNVLYNRKTFTIKFNEYKRVGGVIRPQYEWVENQELRITAKYGEDISEEWQKACENDGWGPEKSGNTQYTLFANMPAENLEMYQKESGTGTTISYYVEGLNGQRKLYSKFQASNGVYLTDEDKQPIEGFQFEDWKKETMGRWDNELWLYYTRNSYSISFENASGMNDKNVKYEATLSSAKPMDNMVKPPEGIDSDSTFGGWYYSPACESGTEVKWNSDTMPAHNVRVYAKWIPAQYTLSFETNGAGNIEPKVLDKYDVIEVPEQNPTKDGYTFLGWFLDENFTKPFTEGFQILEDTTLYAKWVKENETYRYTVQYVDSEGNQIPGVESETLEGEKGSTVTINAKDLDGWYPVVSSKNVTLTKDGLIIQMEYKQAETWKYTIKYMESNSESEQEIRKKVEKTTSSSRVVEYAPNIEGFVPDYEANKGIFKSAERPENDSQPVVITFYYKPIPKTSYTIQYQDEKGKTIFESERKEARVGEYVSVEEAQEITGYKLAKKSSSELSRSAVVKQDGSTIITIYYEKDETQWFTVTFEVDGSGGLLDDQTSYSDILTGTSWETAIQVPQTVANSGYQFDGWYENGERVEHFPTTILSDHTYKAKFKRDFSNIAVEPYEDTYDGKPHSVTVKNTISDEDKILYSTDGIQFLEDEISYTNVRTDNDGKYNVWVKVVNGNVESKAIESYIKIKPKDVTVTANNAEKLFGHEDPTFSATVTGTLNQDKIQYEVGRPGVGKDEAVGTYEDALVATGDEIQGNYKVAYVAGDFEIKTNAEDLKLTAQSGGGVYNASPYYLNNVGATLKGEALKDADIEYKVGDGKWSKDVPSATNVADSLKEISVRVTLEGYQTQQIDDLEITVTHKDVTVTANNAEKLFGHEDPTFSATVTGTLNQDKIQYEVSRPGVGKDEAVGTYEDALVATGDEIQGNYKVAYVAGDFEIKTNAEDLKLTAQSGGGVYNASPYYLNNVGATLKGEALKDADIEYKVGDGKWSKDVPSATNVADSLKEISVRVTLEGYQTQQIDDLEITVTHKDVTVTANNAEKLFGHEDPTFSATVTGTLNQDKIQYEVSRPGVGKDEAVGTYEDALVATGDEIQGNYKVAYVAGDFEIKTNAEDLKLTAQSGGGVYNASPYYLNNVGATLKGEALKDADIEYKVGDGKWSKDVPSATNVADSLKEISVRVTLEGYQTQQIDDLEITVTHKDVTVTANNAEKLFGHEDPTFSATVTGTLNQDKIQYEVGRPGVGKDEAVGTYEDALVATGDEIQGNYKVAYVAGDFEIKTNAEDLKLTAQSGGGVYNASPYYLNNVGATLKGEALKDADIEYKVGDGKWSKDVPSATNVADSLKEISVRVTLEGYQTQQIDDLEITVTHKDVTVTANNAEKLFGHEDPTFSATVTGTLNQDKIQYEVSRPGVGKDEAVGTYEDALVATGDEIQGNYKVAYVAGDFEIKTNAEDLKLTAQSGGGVYNASPYYLNNVGATLKGEALKDADIEYKVGDGKWSKDVPSATNVADSLKEISVRVTLEGYQTQQIDDLEITVTHKDVTVTANNAEKLFGHEDPTFSATVTGTLNQDKIQYEVSRPGVGKDEAVGTYEDALVATGDEIQGNYKVAYVAGDFEIKTNAEDLKFAEAETTGYNGVYDGAAHDAVTSVKVTGVNGEEIAAEDMTVEYRLSDEADWGKMPQVTDVADSTAVQIRVTVANYDPITTTVQATVTQKPVTITTESASKTYDASALTAPGEVEGIVEGETYGFEITGSQTLVGTSENSYVMTWAGEGNEYSAKSDNYTVTERVGTLTVTDGSEEEPINPEEVVKKTHGTPEGGVYKAGDVVTFTVTATNIYDEVKTITLNEIAGVTLKDTVFADVQPGETVETTATYTITEADVLAGEFVNTVTASFSGEEDTPFEDDDQVDEIEEPKGHLTIDKVTTSEPANGSSYALGETITYKITATNDGNLTLTNVKVVDELTGDEWEIASLAPGASEEFDTSYTVTEADILAGSVVNTATAEGTSPDPDKPDVPVNPGEEEEPTETEKPSLFVEKTAQPDEDGVYNLGDEIHYVIKVTNNGNVTVNDITVKDELTGDEWQLDSLTPGESEEYHATYTVTEEDILAGSITNVATAEGTDPDEDPVDQEGEETVPTDSADSHLTIHKATTSDPGDDGAYDLGDTITYEIIAANDGNVTLNNVVVTDELTGDEWIIETLAPGASETFEAEYVVTEEDIHNGSVVNEATATAEGPEEPVITPGETEDETNPENPSLTVDKSIVEEKDEYEIGDVIEYEITVANNGNVTQNDVRVTDLLQAAGDIVITGVEGADGEIDGAIVTLDSLAPGESATIHCEYTVLKEDRGSTITNAAIADDEGKGDGEDPVTPDVPAEVADVYDINVVHQFADGEEGEAELPDDYTIENQPVGTEREITAETVEGYAVSPASQEVTIEDSDVTITFVYYTDEIGTDPENPDTPDNVPDRYQAVVTFEAVNGTVDRSAAVVTLMRNGQPAEDGIGYLTEDQIATARANVGYAQNSLTWSPGTPTAEYKVTGDMTFTASFSAIPVIPGDGGEEPVEPTNPTTPTTPARPSTPTTPTLPVTPANPGTTVTPTLPVTPQTAAPAARVYADGVVVDDPQTATDDYDLNEVERDAGTETIDEDSTPLGNMDLEKDDDHKCCILHFILLLLALIVELIYTHDRKKRQERIFELRRELADFDETV